ncbi:MAG: AAA domain-containing protein [Bacteroidetes bacterium]|nr:AAA domain-containing protein [Bacteroidota bacterium]
MNLINKINRAIDIEYDWKNEEIRELLKLPVEERVLKGDSICNVRIKIKKPLPTMSGSITDKDGKVWITIDKNLISFRKIIVYCDNNISKFREGSRVTLYNDKYSFNLTVSEDHDNEIILETGFYECHIEKKYQNSLGWQLDSSTADIRHIVKRSTEILERDSRKLAYLNGIFEGTTIPVFSSARINKAKKIVAKSKLNSSQRQAFINAYSTKNYYLIQGPPGSGKTWLLAHLAFEFAKEGKKVLITAFTHTAINNALQKTSILSKYQHIIKVGNKNMKENLNNDGSKAINVEYFESTEYNDNSKGVIVGATCYSPFTRKLDFMNWDIIIIDEAGQLNIPLAIAAMVKGEKYILIGDHKQLPPIISEKQNDPVFSKSIFEHLFKYKVGIMLEITYRMNKIINDFPSNQFYEGKLLPHPDNANWILEIDNIFDQHQEILDINKPAILYCHHNHSDNSRSKFEAELIAELVFEYIKKGIPAAVIGVITPFRAQVRQINKSLSNLTIYKKIKDSLFVDTIERIQGQERDIIIYSLVTSDPEKAKQRADFFFNPNRLNVALTRAKKKRIVIAHEKLFTIKTNDPHLKPLIQNFRDFYKKSYKVIES